MYVSEASRWKRAELTEKSPHKNVPACYITQESLSWGRFNGADLP